MACGAQPPPYRAFVFNCRHSSVRQFEDLGETFKSLRGNGLQVACQERLEWFFCLQLFAESSAFPRGVEGKIELHGNRLLTPKCAVVIKDCDAFILGNEVRTDLTRYATNKIHNQLFCSTLSPRRKSNYWRWLHVFSLLARYRRLPRIHRSHRLTVQSVDSCARSD